MTPIADDFADIAARLAGLDRTCGCCGLPGAAPRSSRTNYAWDGQGEDPNGDVMLCDPCAIEHNAFWDAMWEGYYSMLL